MGDETWEAVCVRLIPDDEWDEFRVRCEVLAYELASATSDLRSIAFCMTCWTPGAHVHHAEPG